MEEKADRLCRLAGQLGALGVPIFLFHEGFDPDAAATASVTTKAFRAMCGGER